MYSDSNTGSSLLDIIFQNRNKDYGAYVLRRDYNKRLLVSLALALAIAAIGISFQMMVKKNTPAVIATVPYFPVNTLSSLKQPEVNIPLKKIYPRAGRRSKAVDNTPVIVKDLAGKTIVPNELQLVTTHDYNEEAPPAEEPGIPGAAAAIEEISSPAKPALHKPDHSVPVNSPDVMPQYPGGINELIKFLKRNLHSPRELEEGGEVTVKVRLVVNYGGELTGFTVMESGTEVFDNEVIRVLKKMPRWIPGQKGGESVSAYFVIPVKFTSGH